MKQTVIVIQNTHKTTDDAQRKQAVQAIVNRYLRNKLKIS